MKKVLSQRFMLIVMCVLAAVGVLSAVFMAKSGDVQAGESLAPLDDAYIHLQFARNMVSGQGWSFNAGEPTAGSTAPLFTIVLTGLGCLLSSSMDWLWISRIAGITCHVMMIIIFFRWCCHRSYDLFASSLLSLSLCTTGALLWASVAGMEIALSSLLMAGCLMVHQSRTDTFDRPLLLGMLGGLCVLARPECLLLMLLILFDRCVVVEKHSHNGSPSLTCRLTWSHGDAFFIATFLGMLMLYAAYCTALGISAVPNTFRAKAGFDGIPVAMDYLRDVLFLFFRYHPFIFTLALMGSLVGCRQWMHGKRLFALSAWPWALLLANAIVNPHLYNHGRYVMILIPALALLSLESVAALLTPNKTLSCKIATSGRALFTLRASHRMMVTTVLIMTAAFSALSITTWTRRFAEDLASVRDNHAAAVMHLSFTDGVPRTVATHDIGYIGYATGAYIYDVAGLVTPEVLALRRLPQAEYHERLMQEFRDKSVSYIVCFEDYAWLPEPSVLGQSFKQIAHEQNLYVWQRSHAN